VIKGICLLYISHLVSRALFIRVLRKYSCVIHGYKIDHAAVQDEESYFPRPSVIEAGLGGGEWLGRGFWAWGLKWGSLMS